MSLTYFDITLIIIFSVLSYEALKFVIQRKICRHVVVKTPSTLTIAKVHRCQIKNSIGVVWLQVNGAKLTKLLSRSLLILYTDGSTSQPGTIWQPFSGFTEESIDQLSVSKQQTPIRT